MSTFAEYCKSAKEYADNHKFNYGNIMQSDFIPEKLYWSFKAGRSFEVLVNAIGKKHGIIPLTEWSNYPSC